MASRLFRSVFSTLALGGVVLLTVVAAAPANAATTIDGPVFLGTAQTFSVLGASNVTNTGATIANGDVGVSPGSSITGFPPGIINGTTHATDTVAAQAQSDLTTAYNVAASLTPMQSGLTDLVGLTLTPGVYSGGALSLSGDLTLAGSAQSVWVFQAASTLITGSASHIILTGGASVCNVFWQVASSATLGTASDFAGTIMAQTSVTTNTGTTVAGRLLARTGAVTLDDTVLTAPVGCADASTTRVHTSPDFVQSTPPNAVVNTAYSYRVTATGGTAATYSITSGALPTGLTLDSTTGIISGTPRVAGTFTFTVTAANGSPTVATITQTITVAALTLAATGADDTPLVVIGGGLALVGLTLILRKRRRTALHGAQRASGGSRLRP
jgi:LPXTG-motif cell wall-anchored protein